MTVTLRFSAHDSWFFRESRPHGSVGFSELDSQFPPPARTLAGALRTALGDALGVDWKKFHAGHPVTAQIGFGDDYGPLRFQGPWLSLHGQRLYPWPGNLMHKDGQLRRLGIGGSIHCQSGRIHCPVLPDDSAGFKPLEQSWLTWQGMNTLLAGGMPPWEDIIGANTLYCREPRLGIALDRHRRTARESILYQTRHLRLSEGVSVELDVQGMPDNITLPGTLRLGGESRLAHVDTLTIAPTLPGPGNLKKGRLALYLLTPARFEAGWLPDGFVKAVHDDGSDCWKGHVAGMELTLHAAIVGKARREGGWNQATGQPRPVSSSMPAGSIYYCSLASAASEAVDHLHGIQLGAEQALGRGQVAVGSWPDEEYWSKQ